ncbi:MAG: hypothetical protein KC422_25170 [Trueperaceae bacterium]|nr:hypothetical protein [Trueperaceae bacterium]
MASLKDALAAMVLDSPGYEVDQLSLLAKDLLGTAEISSKQLEELKSLLDLPEIADPLYERLLEYAEYLFQNGPSELKNEVLAEAFRRKREAYRLQFASVFALEAVGEAVTDYFLSQASLMQPFASSDEAETLTCKVLKLIDAEAARFMSFEAKLYNLIEYLLNYHKIMLKFSPFSLKELEIIANKLSLRFIFEDAFTELSTGQSQLFDVEVNQLEKRLYLKLNLDYGVTWTKLESIVVMGENTP